MEKATLGNRGRKQLRRPTGLCGAVWLLCAATAFAQGPTVTVNAPKDVQPGSTVEVKVDLSQVSNLGALFFDLTYDPMQATVEAVSATGEWATQGLFASNPETFPSSSGRLRFGFLHAEGLSRDGTFVTVTFRLAPMAPSPTPIAVEGTSALDAQVTPMSATGVGRAIEALLAATDVRTGLRIFTVPVRLTNPDPAALFGDPAASMRVAAWNPAAQGGSGAYLIYDGTNFSFQTGRAYWVRTVTDKQVRVRRARRSTPQFLSLFPFPRAGT